MKSAMNTVKAYYKAMGLRDANGLRAVLADDFTFHGPLMAFDNPVAFTQTMVTMPFEAKTTDSRFVVGDNEVAHVFLWEMSKPAKAKIPMCEILAVTGGKILRSELFYDSKLFPAG